MGRRSNAELMFEYVREYLDGDMQRMFFDLDFYHYLNKYYPAMERQSPDMAECFVYYLSERGVDISEGLSDAEHRELIRTRWGEFAAALSDGIY